MDEMNLAKRIRGLRVERELTLDEVARRTGLSKSLLSKIENSKVSPPVSTLAKIAAAYNVSLSDFFAQADTEQIKLVRRQERVRYNPEDQRGGHTIETLMSGFRRQKIEPLMIWIDDPRGYTVKYYNHPGHEFILVLEGGMDYAYGDQRFSLEEGDALYFNAETLHGPLPRKNQAVRYISVLCN